TSLWKERRGNREGSMSIRHVVFFTLLLCTTVGPVHADEQLDLALATCRQRDETHREARCYFVLGLADIDSRNIQAARLHLEDAARRFEAAGDPVAAWRAYWVLVEH